MLTDVDCWLKLQNCSVDFTALHLTLYQHGGFTCFGIIILLCFFKAPAAVRREEQGDGKHGDWLLFVFMCVGTVAVKRQIWCM